jgi:hypothetical protein
VFSVTFRPKASCRFWFASVITLLVGVAYRIQDTLQISEPAFWGTSFIPRAGIPCIVAPVASGATRKDCNLRLAWFSKPGIAVLALTFLLLLPVLLSSAGDAGWNWLSALLYAPVGVGAGSPAIGPPTGQPASLPSLKRGRLDRSWLRCQTCVDERIDRWIDPLPG